jgi:hypothetical protein
MTTIEGTDLKQRATEQTDLDAAAVEEFASKLIETITGGLLTCLIEIGRRTGLFELAAAGPATSGQLAQRGGLHERYVREWLAAMATAGVVEYDADNGRFWLPVEHAAVLTGDTYDNLAPVAYLASVVIRRGDAVANCFTDGGGVPWAAYVPEMHDVMDVLWQPMYRDILVQQILPLAPGLIGKLESGTRVADVACGSGNGTLVMARRFPNSTFVGYDADADAIAIACSRAGGLSNVSFEMADAARTATEGCIQPLAFRCLTPRRLGEHQRLCLRALRHARLQGADHTGPAPSGSGLRRRPRARRVLSTVVGLSLPVRRRTTLRRDAGYPRAGVAGVVRRHRYSAPGIPAGAVSACADVA